MRIKIKEEQHTQQLGAGRTMSYNISKKNSVSNERLSVFLISISCKLGSFLSRPLQHIMEQIGS